MRLPYLFPTSVMGVTALVATPFQAAQALSATEVSTIAEAVTVQIDGQNAGSGVIIQRRGNTYTVLTAAHVVATQDEYDIITTDEQRYPLDYSRVKKFPDVDLALVEFSSPKAYQVAELGDSNTIKSGASVYVSGFPLTTAAITERIWNFSPGSVTANARRSLADGYALVYNNNTLPGMSGGAVLDEQGKLIGIHGRADAEQQQQRTETVYVKTGFNLGIPVNTFLSQVPQVSPELQFKPVAPPPLTTTLTADDFFLSASNKFQQSDFQGALADFNQSIRLKPDYAAAYYNRGVVRRNLGDDQGAIADYDQAIQYQPNYADAYFNRGNAFYDLDKFRAALADYSKSIELESNKPDVYMNRGNTRTLLKDYQGAITDYGQAIRLKPDYGKAYYNRAVVRKSLGDRSGALADYQMAVPLLQAQGEQTFYTKALQQIRQLSR